MPSAPKNRSKLIFLIFLLLVVAVAHVAIGGSSVPSSELINALFFKNDVQLVWQQIVWDLRVPRMLTALLAGASLSLAGLQMQTLFRNPLAGPDVLGLTAGAGLGVGICIFLGISFSFFIPLMSLFAFGGAFLVFILILPMTRYIKDQTALLLIGVMISALGSALLGILQFTSGSDELQSYVLWTFGSLGSTTYYELFILLAGLILGIILAFANTKNMNAWPLGDAYLKNLAIPVKRARLLMIVSASILTGITTAYCGPIAFVGLSTPLLVRNWFRDFNHENLIVASCLCGSIVLIVCDLSTHLFSAHVAIPINVATSLLGAPVVIFFIVRLK